MIGLIGGNLTWTKPYYTVSLAANVAGAGFQINTTEHSSRVAQGGTVSSSTTLHIAPYTSPTYSVGVGETRYVNFTIIPPEEAPPPPPFS
jgi:hypothetical protein